MLSKSTPAFRVLLNSIGLQSRFLGIRLNKYGVGPLQLSLHCHIFVSKSFTRNMGSISPPMLNGIDMIQKRTYGQP